MEYLTKQEMLQAHIDKLPKEHPPMPYKVAMLDRRGRLIVYRYVLASSEKRAELTGIAINPHACDQIQKKLQLHD